MLVDLTAPYDFAWSGRGASQAFQIDYADLGLGVETVRAAAARLPSSPVYELVLHHLTALPGILESLQDSPAAEMVGVATTQLVRALLTSAAEHDNEPLAMADVLFSRITWYMRRHLTDPGLSPARIAAAHHVSVRYLYKLFADRHRSLEQWLITERLNGAARQLRDPASKHLPIAAVAARWGFDDAAHFTRRFRTTYGVPPREWRHRANGSGAGG
jgi:AraC-like DNA-binding protein